ncbi:hypothetical protein CYMTET_18746, partial [Cymbomonas tetramitiformis]
VESVLVVFNVPTCAMAQTATTPASSPPAMPAKNKVRKTEVNNIREWWADVMRRKDDDHKASHSNIVNQWLHFLSSSVFIYCYAVLLKDPVTATVYGLLSLIGRQMGHAIFEPPCHDEEELLLGFTTQAKLGVLMTYALTPVLYFGIMFAGLSKVVPWDWPISILGQTSSFDLSPSFTAIADMWLLLGFFFVFGHSFGLIKEYDFVTSMTWLVKFFTDPFTDLPVYYPALWKVFTAKDDWKQMNLIAHIKGEGKHESRKEKLARANKKEH